ncbi:DEAD/DEAH box helicase family protein (plasmid) [Streptomyces goshikiensis]|uniref:DEAD/DEAH box helicase family protein n=1 Tax=Streptomyces goshikiensis TaxID=1942 RepID=UPI002F91379A|nr:DEAD/DEAH box helicase family protein [Streptomyces goshikiensis]
MTETHAPPPPRPHQREALARTVEELTLQSGSEPPAAGLRTQVIMATGSGKTLVAAHTADQVGGVRGGPGSGEEGFDGAEFKALVDAAGGDVAAAGPLATDDPAWAADPRGYVRQEYAIWTAGNTRP